MLKVLPTSVTAEDAVQTANNNNTLENENKNTSEYHFPGKVIMYASEETLRLIEIKQYERKLIRYVLSCQQPTKLRQL
jgi:hypothetical protein